VQTFSVLKRIFVAALFLVFLSDSASAQYQPSSQDLELLNRVEKDTLQYFIRMSDKTSGLTRDSSRAGSPASIAATGFSLSAISIGHSRGWIPESQAYNQLRKTLKFLSTKAEHKNGFFYHFLDLRTGKRIWGSEASSIDTALLVAGALLAGQYFPGTDIEAMANEIYERIDWKWMLNNSNLICMGWKPETGFLPYYWDTYNELIILQALAIGAPNNAIPKELWHAWKRKAEVYNNKKIVYAYSGSLFTYQFAQGFIDFRNLQDGEWNYFENSRLATEANREYSLSFRNQYQTYSETSWGLSASVGPGGYKAYGGKPGEGIQDGTIAPYAAISSIVFTPELSVPAIRFFFENYEKDLYGLFGFKDAFNLDKKWWAQEYLGIDQGISVLMLENFTNDAAVWKKFMGIDAIKRWVELCELDKTEVASLRSQ
jgi:hypothetical protein